MLAVATMHLPTFFANTSPPNAPHFRRGRLGDMLNFHEQGKHAWTFHEKYDIMYGIEGR